MISSYKGLSLIKKIFTSGRILSSVLILGLLPLSSPAQPIASQGAVDPSLNFTERFLENNSRNGIAAIAEGKIITLEDIRRELLPLLPQLQAQYPTRSELDSAAYKLAMGIRQTLIDRILVKADFDRNKFQIPPSYIESRLDEMLLTEFEGDRQRRHEYLKRRGQTFQDYRDELEEKTIIEVMRGRMERSLSMISPAKIQEYYEKHKEDFFEEEQAKIAVIMLSPDPNETTQDILPSANQIYQSVQEGVDFVELAKRYGEDPMGGTPGEARWYQRSDIQPQMAEVAFELKVGETSKPFVFANKVFLFQMVEKKTRGVQSLNEVRDQIERILANQAAQAAMNEWIEGLRSKAYVQLFDL
jgi:peptidyl-prolyl cis-trans isomerase SurA